MSDEFSDLLRSIGVHTSLERLQQSAQRIRSTAASTADKELAAEMDANAAMLEAEIASLLSQLQEVSDRIERYEEVADESLPEMLQIADNFVADFRSASDATRMYNADWFSRLLLSQSAKQRFARHLLRQVLKHTTSNTDTLRMIAEGDPQMLAIIRKPAE